MTIKQHGGVFGRNPTFNDVTVEGDLTVDGAVVHTGDLTVDNLNLSGNTISSTDTNGLINLQPNGTGYVFVRAPSNGTIAKLGDGSSRTFFIKQANVGGYDNDTLIIESDSGVGQFQWKNGGGERLRINTGGDVKLVTGNLVIGTSGKGIDFSATAGTGTSELLDDYEEGVWTPTATSQTGAITTYTSSGTYTKIGRSVTITAGVVLTDVGTAAGKMFISSLPFAPVATAVYLGVAREEAITGNNWYGRLATSIQINGATNNAITWTNSYEYVVSLTYITAV